MAKTCNAPDCDNFCFGGGYCKFHQYMRTDKKPKELNRVPLQRLSTTSIHNSPPKKIKAKGMTNNDVAVFKEIWKERPHVSQLSGTPLPMFDIWNFHHVLTKQAYPEYREHKENIVLLTRTEHRSVHDHTWEDLIAIDPRWSKIHDVYLYMKQYGKETKERF